MSETRIYQMILRDPDDRIVFDQYPVIIWWQIYA